MRALSYRLLILVLFICVPAFGQSNPNDPLDPMYMPSIDMNAADYPSNIWVTSSLAKVHQETATPGAVKWALVSAARNEFQGFQVHEQAGTSAVSLNVSVSDLVNARTGTHISSSSNIIIYREAYMKVVTPSDANGSTGYIPDILIPTVDPYRKQARNAFPFTIAAGQTQSIWFDVFVPPGTPSGYYQGTVTVTNGSSTYATLPVLLSVWNFTLPSTATLKSLYGSIWDACFGYYGSYNNCGAYPGSGGSPDMGSTLSDIDVAVMMLDHRISAGEVAYPGPQSPPNNWTAFNSTIGPLLNGTPANTTTILSGAALTELVYMSGTNSVVVKANLQDWMNNFVSRGWQSKLIAYSTDEPTANGTWPVVLSNGPIFHSTTPSYPALVTADIADLTSNGASTDVDILVPIVNYMEPQGGSNQRSSYSAWLSGAPNRQLWMYQSCMSHGCSNGNPGGSGYTWPSLMIDATPVRNRVMQWVEYADSVTGDLYWEVDNCWWGGCQDGAGNSGADPWTYIYTAGGNGDGTLIYPGTTAKIGGTSPIPLPSVRLKNVRDGMQDYEYLSAVTAAGFGSFAMSQVQTFVTNAYTFNNDPTALLAARSALGGKLHQLSLSTTTLPQPPPAISIIQVK